MKILQVIDSLHTGGAESLLVELCLQWKKRGLDPEVFVLRNGNPGYHARLLDSRIGVTVSPWPQIYSPMHAREISKTISDKRFDLVHVHLHPAQVWAAIALKATRGAPPAITTEHNTWNRRRSHKWYRPIDRWVYSQFWTAVCIGTSTKTSLDEWLGPRICQTCVIPNGIDLTRFRTTLTPACLPGAVGDAPTILCTGSLTGRKDQETLIRAIARINEAHLLLAGDGPMRQSLQKTAEELRIEQRVHFLGNRSDIPELIAASTVYVQPSRVDGFCIAALEAMAGGLPVIASDIPGLGDLVRDCSLLFPIGDHLQLAACIQKLLVDSELAGQLSERGFRRAQQFSIEKTAARYHEIFKETAGRVASIGRRQTMA